MLKESYKDADEDISMKRISEYSLNRFTILVVYVSMQYLCTSSIINVNNQPVIG